MTSSSATPALSVRHLGWWAVVVALAYAAWDAGVRSRHVLQLSERYGVAVDAPPLDPASPTGYANGRRSLVLPSGEADTAHWIMQTQAMIAAGDFRLHHVDYDNAPSGREVHWAAPFHWWLAALAWADHAVSGRPLGVAVERATLTSGPVMLLLLLLGLTPLLNRKFSPWAAALAALGSVTVFAFYTDFLPARADHHGLVNICSLINVLCLLVATTAGGTGEARRWFAGSAVACGLGVWVSAATELPVMLGLGLGVLAAAWVGRGSPGRIAWLVEPDLWRFWGRLGGAISFTAYLVEYFPSHLGMRLEVNHPLYSLAWVGAGEVLRVAVRALRDGAKSLTRKDLVLGGAGTVLVALLPAIIATTKAKTFLVSDPFVWRLHTLYIAELQSLWKVVVGKEWSWSSLNLVWPVLWLVPALGVALRRTTAPEARALLWFVLLPALLGWLMSWNQVRWLGLAYALSVPVMAVFFRILAATDGTKRAAAWAAAFALVLLPGAVAAVQLTAVSGDFTTEEIRCLAERDTAHWLKLRVGAGRVVVASSPNPSTNLIYYGGLTGVDTLYWENAAGLKAAAELFAAPSSPAAREIAARLGLTHIVLFTWESFETALVRLQLGLPDTAPLPPDTFAARLWASPVPPPWLRAIALKLPAHPELAGTQMRIWEVAPEQTVTTALARATNYFLELDRVEDAQRLAPLLARFGDDLSVAVMQAGLASRLGDPDAFAAAFNRVLARLAGADSLALDERIHLVVVLAVGQRPDLAQAQLQSCVNLADEPGLRQLSPGTLADLLALSDGLGVALPGPARKLGESLLPPDLRK